MKIRAKRDFQYENEDLEEGKVYELPDSVAEQAIEKDYAEKAEGEEEKEEEEKPQLEVAEEEKEGETPEIGKAGEDEEESAEEVEVGGSGEGSPWEEMQEKLDEEPENPPKWNPPRDDAPDPEEVDDLMGEVQSISRNVTANQTDVAAVKTRGGEDLSLWCHMALDDLFERIEVGDRIAVRYTGTRESKSGRTYLTYRYELYDEDGEHKLSG